MSALSDSLRDIFLGGINEAQEEAILKALQECESQILTGIVNVNDVTSKRSGTTMLHSAAYHGKFKVVRWLLEHKADPNAQDRNGLTAMHYLVKNPKHPGQRDTITLIAEYGGSLDICDNRGQTAQDYGLRDNFDVKNFVLNSTTKPDAKFPIGDFKLVQEEANDREKVEAEIQRLFASISDTGNQDTALQLLSSSSQQLDMNAVVPGHRSKWRLLHAACAQSNIELVRVLLEKRADPNLQTAKGNTALHLIVPQIDSSDGKRIIEALVEAGADITVSSYLRGQTPIDLIRNQIDVQWLKNLTRSVAQEKSRERANESKEAKNKSKEEDDAKGSKFLDDLLMSSGFYESKTPKQGGIFDQLLGDNAYSSKVQGSRNSANDKLLEKLKRGKQKKSSNLIDELLGGAMTATLQEKQQKAEESFLAKLKRGKKRAAVGLLDQLLQSDGMNNSLAGFKNNADNALMAKLMKGKNKKSTNLLDKLLATNDMSAMLSGKQMSADEMLRAKLAKGKKKKTTLLDKMMGEPGMAENLAGARMGADEMLKAKLAQGKQKHQDEKADHYQSDPVDATVFKIFKMLDRDGNGSLRMEELQQLMMVIGDKLGLSAEDLMSQADISGTGMIDPQELVDWFKKRATTLEELQDLQGTIADGIEGAAERYQQAASLLKGILTGNSNAYGGSLSSQQADAAELLRYKLLKGKKKASKNLLDSLLDGGDMGKLLHGKREDANAKLLAKLAQAKKQKEMRGLIDDVMGTKSYEKYTEDQLAASLANLAAKLAMGKTKESRALVDQLIRRGIFEEGRKDDPNLNLTLVTLEIFKLLDTDNSREIEFNELEQLMMIVGDKLGSTAVEVMNEADTNGNGGIDPKELVKWVKRRGKSFEELVELRNLIQKGIGGAIERYQQTRAILKGIAAGNIPAYLSESQKNAADLLQHKLMKGKDKASKDLLRFLGDKEEMAKLFSTGREEANRKLLEKLAAVKNKKQMQNLLDNIFDTDNMLYLLQRGKDDAHADLLAKLARGKSKKSQALLRKLLEEGSHFMPNNEDLGLLITLLVVDIFHLLDADGSKSLERKEIDHFILVCGRKLEILAMMGKYRPKVTVVSKFPDYHDSPIAELVKWFKKRNTTLDQLREIQRLVSAGIHKMEGQKLKKEVKKAALGIHNIVEDDKFLMDLLRKLGLDPETLRVLANYLVDSKRTLEKLSAILRSLLDKYELCERKHAKPAEVVDMVEDEEIRASQMLATIVDTGFDVLKTVVNHSNLDEAARAILKAKVGKAERICAACEELIRYIAGDHAVVESALKTKSLNEKVLKILLAVRSQNREKQKSCCKLIAHKLVDQTILFKIVKNPGLAAQYSAKLTSRLKQQEPALEELNTVLSENLHKLVSCLDVGNVGSHATLLKVKSEEDEARLVAIEELHKILSGVSNSLKTASINNIPKKMKELQKKFFALGSLLMQIVQDDEALEQTWQKLKDMTSNIDSSETRTLIKKWSYLPVKKDAVQRFLQTVSEEIIAQDTVGEPDDLIAILKAKIEKGDDPKATDLLRQLLGDKSLIPNILKSSKQNAEDWLKRKLKKGKYKRSSELLQELIGDEWLTDHLDKEKLAAEEALKLKLLRKSKKSLDDDVSQRPQEALKLASKDFSRRVEQITLKKASVRGRLINELVHLSEDLDDDDNDDNLWEMDIGDISEDFQNDMEILFHFADEYMDGALRADQMLVFLRNSLGINVSLCQVEDAMKMSTPKPCKVVPKEFFLPVIQAVLLIEKRSTNIDWDFNLLDSSSAGCLQKQSSEALWAANRIERSQPGLRTVARNMGIKNRYSDIKISWPEMYTNLVASKVRVNSFYYEGEYEPELN